MEKAAIRAYQAVGRPIARPITNCRYSPSCSVYAMQSLDEHGFWGGNRRIAGRLIMCSPVGWAIDQFKDEEQPRAETKDPG
ncbi:MAG: membrane protein insertion efficiency factor YidD [Acidobacteriota bacterium]|nr:membrane protein insertion efficiency factor YidD [Acidobacteriota bacterium]